MASPQEFMEVKYGNKTIRVPIVAHATPEEIAKIKQKPPSYRIIGDEIFVYGPKTMQKKENHCCPIM